MPLKLMYITNNPGVASIAEKSGVDRIFVDMEFIGKAARQTGMDSVQNHHSIEDVRAVRAVVSHSDLLVRVNPVHNRLTDYPSSEEEIESVIDAGADIIMLPYFKTIDEIRRFISIVDGSVRTMLLLETKEANVLIDQILEMEGIDEIHIGLNDLALSYDKKFLFELLTDGTVERLCRKMQCAGMFYGFGGIASIGRGRVPAEMIIREHYRLGSRMAILSRSFCNINRIEDLEAVEEIFFHGMNEIRTFEKECQHYLQYFTGNKEKLDAAVRNVVSQID